MGYWNQPEETAKAIRNGWLLTGDIGYRDADGYYFITDRKKDMLLVNGINVYPREVEEILYQFPGVKEAAVIGVPDARKGEQPLAFVAASEGATLDEKALLQFIAVQAGGLQSAEAGGVFGGIAAKCDGKSAENDIARDGEPKWRNRRTDRRRGQNGQGGLNT